MSTQPWLEIKRGNAPIVVALPHTGTVVPDDIAAQITSPWLALKDTDWHIDQLYGFVHDELDATVIRTQISRTCIDLNRDPDGHSLYPGQATTELCPTTSFDGEPLYLDGLQPTVDEVARRRSLYFEPYHHALRSELQRLRVTNANVVLYDAHSIRSVIPRLFSGELPALNLGTNSGASCSPTLQKNIVAVLQTSPFTNVLNGRFKGGWTTRHYGRPSTGIHAIQMEIACRTFLNEPAQPSKQNWPSPLDETSSKRLRVTLRHLLNSCLDFAKETA